MKTKKLCPDCGAELPSPEGICPQCLIAQTKADSITPRVGYPTVLDPQVDKARATTGVLGKVKYLGDYELQEEIARGGMGIVYKARQTSLNRMVAVKTILAGQLASEGDVMRFRTEAEAAANLQHPNIVAIHEVGEHEGLHYFSMDYVDGKSLAELINGVPLHPTKAASYVQTIAEAVHFAHQRGTLHRDLKPQNVLIDSADQPRITDFGLAKRMNQAGDRTRAGAVMGSPNYMPPEQAAGRQDLVGPHSDVYSLGAILYELVTGKPPLRAETVIATLAKVLQEPPVAPRKLNPRVPAELETICLKCLEKEPSRRYTTARELADELGRLLRQEPILASPSSGTRKTVLWFKRNPWFLTGVILAIAVGLLWLAYAQWAENRDLVWEKAHPGETRPADWLTRSFGYFSYFVLPIITVLPWTKPFERKRRERILTGKRIPVGLLFAYGLLSATGVALALYAGTKAIDFYRWDNQPAKHLERIAEFKSWQSLTNLNPFCPVNNPPRIQGFSRIALELWLACAFFWACICGNLSRKVSREYLFIMFPSADQEEIEQYCALQAKQHEREDISFRIVHARPRTAIRLTAVGSVLGLGVAAVFALVVNSQSEMVAYLVIPVGTVTGWALSLPLVVLRQGPSLRWLLVKVVTIVASFAASRYLLAHHEHELVWIGLVFGFVCGIVHGIALRAGLIRCRRWSRKRPTG